MRKAKIICTLGPSSDSAVVIEALIRAGMNVARLNFSHGTPEEHRRRVQRIRRASSRLGVPVAILQDVQGPKIRLGRFEGGRLEVKTGEQVVVTTRKVLGQGHLIPTPIRSLPRDVEPGHPILLDDGRVRLRVDSVSGQDVTCTVEQGGVLKDHKGLNLPGAHVSVPTITAKDREDLAFGQELGVDYVALSFVRSAEDIQRARALVARDTPLIAKIEKPQAVDHLDAIARAADGIMVARGDLGVEMPLEKLPALQKQMVRLVNRLGGLTIVATEMLESMVTSARPTRAEVSDVANAILDGADAVMLSGETAAGKFPVEAVATMASIVEEIETGSERTARDVPFEHARDDISTGVAAAAVAAAEQMRIGTIVAYTERGRTAQLISEFRPGARVVALTPNPETVNRMALYWGVTPLRVGRLHSTDAMLRQVRRLCREEGLCPGGAPVVIVAGVPLNEPGSTNMISVHRI
ncbi:Pyruvate kinase [Cystobacter fuscus DSM 2262]|uniref:Pyruvate kinase n=1 Tax=Cystobacter fuscus (strain ATCC 25194 / DSM 2262 / NBRC 100088 / M29) TaxID=1242864 RepID=S9NVN6_CYSF2|nr:pyruvate kinase [Cystobacter fuscus]EPX56250.1 Pyruvate kinase [Cystobacter fuscus DSM 2262]